MQGIWHRTVGGTDRGVGGQRRRRVVSRHPQERTRQPKQLPHPPPRPPIDPMVDRSLVQPPPASLHDRTTATKRMGGQLLPSHGRINQVSSTWGELQPSTYDASSTSDATTDPPAGHSTPPKPPNPNPATPKPTHPADKPQRRISGHKQATPKPTHPGEPQPPTNPHRPTAHLRAQAAPLQVDCSAPS